MEVIERGLRSRTGTSPCVPQSSFYTVFLSRGRILTYRDKYPCHLNTLFYEFLARFHSHLINSHDETTTIAISMRIEQVLYMIYLRRKQSISLCAIVPGSGTSNKKSRQLQGFSISLISRREEIDFNSMGLQYSVLDLIFAIDPSLPPVPSIPT